jgi:peptide/nickel transport system ATP-binding protein
VEDLHVSFRVYEGTLRVVEGLSFFVQRGEKVGVVGEAGCGKTTTMKAVMRILADNATAGGRIVFDGRDVMGMRPGELQEWRRRSVSLVFQDPTSALNPVFTVGDQMRAVIGSALEGAPDRGDATVRQIAERALVDVSLPDPARILANYPFQLSGGMRQRICIAMAVATSRQLLLADEPGTSLDVTIQDQILRLIGDLVRDKGLSVVLVTHSLGVVREMTDRVYIMYAGTMVESGPTSEIFKNPQHPYTMGLMGCVPRLTGAGISQGIPGGMPDYLNPPVGCRFAPRCPEVIEICHRERPANRPVGPGGHCTACHRRGSGC